VVVSDVGDVDGKLVIDGVDVHAMMFLIASMFYKPPIRWRSAGPHRWPEGLRSVKI
jgi:hypothetical protein